MHTMAKPTELNLQTLRRRRQLRDRGTGTTGTAYEVRQSESGWDVVDADSTVMASFTTNAQAWRFVDRREGSPVSRSESVTEWIMSRD
jgi:hypothetical protein